MIKWVQKIIDFILPPRCLICGKCIHSDNSLCSECFSNINFISYPYCKHCGMPLPINISEDYYCPNCLVKKDCFRLCRSAVKYDEFSKTIILDFKFSDHLENKKLLTNWLYLAGQDIFKEGIDVIIPVPLHIMRLLKRKYNQSAVLVSGLSKLTGIPADYKVLRKIRNTTPQILCNKKQRTKNLKQAFEVTFPQNIKNKRILLIDDVYTTGSTLKECANVLLKAGAKSVDALTIAKVCD